MSSVKLFSEIRSLFSCDDIIIKERLNTAEASFTFTFQSLPNLSSILQLNTLIPSRDTITLKFKNDSGDIVFVSNHQIEEPDFSILISNLVSEDQIYVSVQIDKNVSDQRFSIYDFASFTDDLLKRPLLDVLSWFSTRLQSQKSLMFTVFDYDISLSTRTMAFESCEDATFKPKVDRSQRLSACKDTAYFYNMNTFEVIPDDFIIEGVVRAGDCLKPLFGKLATILSLAYVATSASLNNKIINVQINGQRTVNYELLVEDIREDEKWQNIYSWIFTDGNPTDKALIAHNVISLHCKFEAILNLNATVFDAIKTNYNLYLRNNVNQYLDMKRDIAKFIQDVVVQISDYAIAILGKFKANLFAIFGFLFTVVLTKIGGTQKWDEIFTRHTMYLLEIFIGGSLVYLVICFYETRYKLKKAKQGYYKLKKNYEDVLSDTELNEVFKDDELLKSTVKSAEYGLFGWSISWGILLLLAIVIIEVLTTNHGLIIWLWNKVF